MPLRIKHFIYALIMLMFVTLANTSYSQVNDNSYDYIFSHRYSGIHNLIFLNSQGHIGTEIAQSDKKKVVVSKKIEEDTTNQKNSISIRESNDGERVLVCLDLSDYDLNVEIIVYNMLGKKVYDVWNGKAVSGNDPCPKEYEIPKGKLPNGLYLCVAQSEKFRMVGKFVISR